MGELGHGPDDSNLPRPDQGDLGPIPGWSEELGALAGCGNDDHAGHRPDTSVQTQLTRHPQVGDGLGRQLTVGDQDCNGNRQIQTGTLFAHVAGCEVDRDAPLGPTQAAVAQRRPHAVPGLPAGRVGHTNYRIGRKTVANVNFNPHRDAVYTVDNR